jgi:hypothetical protein
MPIKVNQFSISAKINDQQSSQTFPEKQPSSGTNLSKKAKEELIQQCLDKVVDYINNERNRF